jgi:hypothetical protein
VTKTKGVDSIPRLFEIIRGLELFASGVNPRRQDDVL